MSEWPVLGKGQGERRRRKKSGGSLPSNPIAYCVCSVDLSCRKALERFAFLFLLHFIFWLQGKTDSLLVSVLRCCLRPSLYFSSSAKYLISVACLPFFRHSNYSVSVSLCLTACLHIKNTAYPTICLGRALKSSRLVNCKLDAHSACWHSNLQKCGWIAGCERVWEGGKSTFDP